MNKNAQLIPDVIATTTAEQLHMILQNSGNRDICCPKAARHGT